MREQKEFHFAKKKMFWFMVKTLLIIKLVDSFPQDISFPESGSQRLDAKEPAVSNFILFSQFEFRNIAK